jgi:hypothetical protein
MTATPRRSIEKLWIFRCVRSFQLAQVKRTKQSSFEPGKNRAVTSTRRGGGVNSRQRQPSLLPCRSFHDGREPCVRSGLIEKTRKRTVTECFGAVGALTRIPLINNHLDRHLASPNAAGTPFLVCSCCESPMTAFPVDLKRRWNTVRRGGGESFSASRSLTFRLLIS